MERTLFLGTYPGLTQDMLKREIEVIGISSKNKQNKKMLVSILGSGNIGCDLLVKCLEREDTEVVKFVGRHANSKGLSFAAQRGVAITDKSRVPEGTKKPNGNRLHKCRAPQTQL